MLLNFLYELRERRVAVGLQEWMALLDGLARGLHESSLTGFYHLARSLLVHSEVHFDAFDEAFARCFGGIESDSAALTAELAALLTQPELLSELGEEQRAMLEALELDRLRQGPEEGQSRRPDSGEAARGVGRTDAVRQEGDGPALRRVGAFGTRSAVALASERRYQAYRNDLVLDVRSIKVALRRLRELRREGTREELDLPLTVDRTCRNAGELELIWRPPRRNNAKVLLLMDVGGSMDPHARVVSQLFSAANQSKHFRELRAYYFHNCVYRSVYRDPGFTDATSLDDVVASIPSTFKLVMVGDALMHPLELMESERGAGHYSIRSSVPGIQSLRRLADHFDRRVWLNPEPERVWQHPTAVAIRELFPMFPLTLDGLEDAVATLVKGRRPPRRPDVPR